MEGIAGMNYIRPSRIQAAALPLICPPKSKNMIGQAANGSGKTATFSLGMLSQIDPKLNAPQALVMAPTRELAIQTEEVVEKLGKFMGVKVLKILPQGERIEKGRCEHQICVGTPGRVQLKLCSTYVYHVLFLFLSFRRQKRTSASIYFIGIGKLEFYINCIRIS